MSILCILSLAFVIEEVIAAQIGIFNSTSLPDVVNLVADNGIFVDQTISHPSFPGATKEMLIGLFNTGITAGPQLTLSHTPNSPIFMLDIDPNAEGFAFFEFSSMEGSDLSSGTNGFFAGFAGDLPPTIDVNIFIDDTDVEGDFKPTTIQRNFWGFLSDDDLSPLVDLDSVELLGLQLDFFTSEPILRQAGISRFDRIDIGQGCTGLFTSALFVSGILSCPVEARKKLIGLLIGIPAFFVFGILRVVIMAVVAVTLPARVEVFHVYIMAIANLGFAMFVCEYRSQRRLRVA